MRHVPVKAGLAGMARLAGHQLSAGAGILFGNTEFEADSDTPFSGSHGGNQAGLAPVPGTHVMLSLSEDFKVGKSLFSVAGASLDLGHAAVDNPALLTGE